MGHAVTNPEAIGSDGLPIGQTTHLPPPTAPAITAEPANQSGLPGSVLTFSVEATGNPAPSYQWLLDGTAIAGAIESTLEFADASLADEGTYSVEVSNTEGTVLSENATLSIIEPDTDGDSIGDFTDNCTNLANIDQLDSDGDGIGNRCDADLNNDCLVDFVDFAIFRLQFFTTGPTADFDGSSFVDFIDFAIFRSLFFQPPGPSATECAI